MLAKKYHREQKYGDKPYMYHILSVVNLAEKHMPIHMSYEKVISSAFLHDIVEDTDIDVGIIKDNFPEDVYEAVLLLTDESGKNRKERKFKTNLKMSKTNNEIAIFVKMCDRLANIQHSILTKNKSKLSMYKKEYDDFKSELIRKEFLFLWNIIDREIQTCV